MSFKKRATKSIALALVGITVATPVFNTVSATESESIPQITTRQIVDTTTNAIEEFKSLHGDEDTFKLVKEEDNIKYEVNPKQGIIKATILNEEGIIEDTISINYLNNLQGYKSNPEELSTDNKESRYSRVFETDGPDQLKLTVNSQSGTSRYKLTAHGAQGWDNTKTYTKEGSSWNTGNTREMNNFTRYAQDEFIQMRNKLGYTWISQVVSVLADLVKDSKYSVTVSVLKNLLEIAGVTGTGLAALGEGINYLYNVGRADRAYHNL